MVRGPGGGRGQHHRLDHRQAGGLHRDVRGWPVADGSVSQPPGVLRLLVGGLSLGVRNKNVRKQENKNKTKTCGFGDYINISDTSPLVKSMCEKDNGSDNYGTEIIKYSGEEETVMMEVTDCYQATAR